MSKRVQRRWSPQDVRALAREAGVEVRVVENVCRGRSTPLAARAVVDAARRLGLDLTAVASQVTAYELTSLPRVDS